MAKNTLLWREDYMGEEKSKALVIMSGTGEIVGELNEGDRILRKESVEFLANTEEWRMENFYIGNVDEIKQWMNDLSTLEKAFLFSIVPYISYDDCHLTYKNGRDIGTEDLVVISGLSRSSTYDVIRSLVQKDIMYKGENSKCKQYFINPWLFCKGNRLNKVLRTMFKNYRIRVLDNQRWSELRS